MASITEFLLTHHYPHTNTPAARKPKPPATPPEQPTTPIVTTPALEPPPIDTCTGCGAKAAIIWGRNNYFWKCPKCNTNMPIKHLCPKCKKRTKLRKAKTQYFKYCKPCDYEELYYTSRTTRNRAQESVHNKANLEC